MRKYNEPIDFYISCHPLASKEYKQLLREIWIEYIECDNTQDNFKQLCDDIGTAIILLINSHNQRKETWIKQNRLMSNVR